MRESCGENNLIEDTCNQLDYFGWDGRIVVGVVGVIGAVLMMVVKGGYVGSLRGSTVERSTLIDRLA